jgi:hypothetical protein
MKFVTPIELRRLDPAPIAESRPRFESVKPGNRCKSAPA